MIAANLQINHIQCAILFQSFKQLIDALQRQQEMEPISNYKTILKNHQSFLSKFKVFPDATRKAIYYQLLQLPLNHDHFLQLTKPFPLLPEHTLNKQVAFIVSVIARLYPQMSNQWVPGLIYPFVKLFENDAIACLEVSLTFLLNWYQPLFDNYPQPSEKIMLFFSKHLPKLQEKINSLNYPLGAVVNPMLLVCLTDALSKQDTLQVLDFLVSRPYMPEYFLCVALHILKHVEGILCKKSSVQAIVQVLKREKKINISELIKQAKSFFEHQQPFLQSIYSKTVFPLSRGRYPLHQFLITPPPSKHRFLQAEENSALEQVSNKFEQLQKLVNKKFREGANNASEINRRYAEVEGQMLQYLEQVKKEHDNKIQALRDLERDFKLRVNNQANYSHQQYSQTIDAIERRGRLQKQIKAMEQEAHGIRLMEQDLMRRLQETTQIKRQQLLQANLQLRQKQRELL